MKNSSKLLIFACLILGFFAFHFFTKKDNSPLLVVNENVEVREIQEIEKNIKKEDDVVLVDVKYPEVSGFSKSALVNIFLEKEIKNVVGEFVSNSYPIAPGLATEKNQIQGFYEIHKLVGNVFSIVFNMWEYPSGAAHGNPYTLSYVFNIETGERLSLRDFFKEDTDYLKVVSDSLRISLKEVLLEWYDEAWVFSGTEPRKENLHAFFVTEDTFVFIFDTYQVAPYAAGKYEIEIKKEELKNYLK